MAGRGLRETGVRPITHLSLVDKVTAELRRAILTGAIQPGSTVSIVELCEQFDVSHIPVREALRRLESEGIVSLRPGRSAVVAPVDADDLAEIYRIRRLVEGDLAARSARRLDAARLAEAERQLQEYASVEREPEALAEAHHRFHSTLLGASAGDWDHRVLDLLWHAADRYLHLVIGSLDMAQENLEKRVHSHKDLLEVARSGDSAALRKAWVAHLNESEADMAAGLARRVAG